MQRDHLAQLVDQIPLIGKMDRFGVINKTDKTGRPGGHLGGIEKFEAAALVQGRLLPLNRIANDPVQCAGIDAEPVFVIHFGRQIQNPVAPLAGQRGNSHGRGIG